MKNLRYKIAFLCIISLMLTSCYEDSDGDPGDTSIGGSLASFAISDNSLYTINDGLLVTYDISDANDTIRVIQSYVYDNYGNAITNLETIFPYGHYLFLGANDGMYIIDITNPSDPEYVSMYEHIVSCDPVVVQDSIAYVTLRAGNDCWQETNELIIIDISDIENPKEITTYEELESPYGLGIDGDLLFICDNNMLKVFNCSDPENIQIVEVFDGITATDVIPMDSILIVLGDSEINQYLYIGEELTLLSTISNE